MKNLDSRTKDAIAAAALTVFGFGACTWMLISSALSDGDIAPMRGLLCGLGITVCYVLHLVFVGIAAHRLNRSVAGWVALTGITFPIASIVALTLLLWVAEEPGTTPTRPA